MILFDYNHLAHTDNKYNAKLLYNPKFVAAVQGGHCSKLVLWIHELLSNEGLSNVPLSKTLIGDFYRNS